MSARVLIVIPYHIPIPLVNGGHRGIYFPAQHLANTDAVYTYTIRSNSFDFAKKNFNVMSNGKGRYLNLLMAFKIKRIIKEHKINVVQFEHPYLAWLMLFLRIFSSVKISLHAHNIEHHRFRQLGKKWWPIFKLYEKLAFACADVVYYKTKEDKDLACKTLNACKENGVIIYYGVDLTEMPSAEIFEAATKEVKTKHEIGDEKIILFNGSLSYLPNEIAVQQIIDQINPLLNKELPHYKIVICGKGLNQFLQDKITQTPEIIYAGFVEDIDIYFKACDLFINPVVEGGGVKTKLIEALGFGKPSVSYFSGSFGAEISCTNGRLDIVEDFNTVAFVNSMILALKNPPTDANLDFYKDYSWVNIASKISAAQQKLLE